MIDSHVHLIWDCFSEDLPEIIQRAKAENINKFVHPCVELKDLEKMKILKKKFPEVFIAAGVHPCHAGSWNSTQNEPGTIIFQNSSEIIAIGETGLDCFDKTFSLVEQERVFREQCKIANQLKLPLIIHCRDAFSQTLQILEEQKILKGGVMHCYTGDSEYSSKFWELGFYTSFSGCLTFKNSQKLRAEAKKIPLERVLIETDAPFLAPQKNRGKRNEPFFMKETAKVLADLHQVDLDYINKITTKNTEKLFSI